MSQIFLKIVIVVMLPLLILSGCGGNKNVTANNYTITKGRFKLRNKFQLTDTMVLSPNALYKRNYPGDSSWFKFYKDGKVVLGYGQPGPKLRISGLAGFYSLAGNNITIELSYTTQFDIWDNLIIKGWVVGDTLKFYRDRSPGQFGNLHHFTSGDTPPVPQIHYYIKCYQPISLPAPDW